MAKKKRKNKMKPIRCVTINADKNVKDAEVCESMTSLRSRFRRYRNYDGAKLTRELVELACESEEARLEKEEGKPKRRRAS